MNVVGNVDKLTYENIDTFKHSSFTELAYLIISI